LLLDLPPPIHAQLPYKLSPLGLTVPLCSLCRKLRRLFCRLWDGGVWETLRPVRVRGSVLADLSRLAFCLSSLSTAPSVAPVSTYSGGAAPSYRGSTCSNPSSHRLSTRSHRFDIAGTKRTDDQDHEAILNNSTCSGSVQTNRRPLCSPRKRRFSKGRRHYGKAKGNDGGGVWCGPESLESCREKPRSQS
jgi:hypothetical protein